MEAEKETNPTQTENTGDKQGTKPHDEKTERAQEPKGASPNAHKDKERAMFESNMEPIQAFRQLIIIEGCDKKKAIKQMCHTFMAMGFVLDEKATVRFFCHSLAAVGVEPSLEPKEVLDIVRDAMTSMDKKIEELFATPEKGK